MSESQPLVSVIIPAYHAAPYIAEAIDSVLGQTYQHIEIIVVHRDSGDGTDAVLKPYLSKKAILYIEQEGKGLSNARNLGIRRAHGEFIALLDADDIFLPEKIEKQVGYFEKHPHCDVCYSGAWHFMDGKPDMLLKLNYTYYSG